MATVADFRNAVSSGLTRQHKWNVIVNFPTFAGSNDDARQAALLARTTTMPSSMLGEIDLIWAGRKIPMPGDRTFEPIPVTFISVNDQNVRDAFETWSEYINGSESNSGAFGTLDDVFADVEMQLLGINDEIVKTYILRDAWPKEITGLEMDKGAQDSYGEFTVTFSYLNTESNTTR